MFSGQAVGPVYRKARHEAEIGLRFAGLDELVDLKGDVNSSFRTPPNGNSFRTPPNGNSLGGIPLRNVIALGLIGRAARLQHACSGWTYPRLGATARERNPVTDGRRAAGSAAKLRSRRLRGHHGRPTAAELGRLVRRRHLPASDHADRRACHYPAAAGRHGPAIQWRRCALLLGWVQRRSQRETKEGRVDRKRYRDWPVCRTGGHSRRRPEQVLNAEKLSSAREIHTKAHEWPR